MEFEKYGKIRQLGHNENINIFVNDKDKIYIQEKIDGGNFRFYVTKDKKIIYGSRSQQLTSNVGEETNVTKNFRRCLEFIKKTVDINKLKAKHIYYGECCIKHTMNYDWDKIPPYLGFDIKDMSKEQHQYVEWSEAEKHFKDIGLPVVPVYKIICAKEVRELKIDDDWIPISEYAPKENPNLQAEGVCFKNYDYSDERNNTHIFSKYVREKFKEDNALMFGGSVKYSEDDSGKIVARFCTNARIEKIIFKLVDEEHKLDLKMMGFLPRILTKDIYEENWEEILYSNMKLDMKKVKKMIMKRCLSVLKQIMVNNTLNKE